MDNPLRSYGVRMMLAPFIMAIGHGDVAINILKFPATFDLIGSKFHLVPSQAQAEIIDLVKQPMTDESASRIKDLLLGKDR